MKTILRYIGGIVVCAGVMIVWIVICAALKLPPIAILLIVIMVGVVITIWFEDYLEGEL